MERSADLMGLPALPRPLVERAVAEVLEANAHLLHSPADVLRITYTEGTAPLGSDRAAQRTPRLLAAIALHDPVPQTTAVITVPWTRNENGALAGVKSTSYGENALALARAHAAGASEAIFANTAGRLCEGTGSNIFLVLDGRLITPPLGDGCLAGITRALVLEWTDAIEASVPMTALAGAQEAFLTSSRRDVQAVTIIDGHPLGDGDLGPVTRATMNAFNAGQARSLDP
jgi:branched-chain amino acid aminotransferase